MKGMGSKRMFGLTSACLVAVLVASSNNAEAKRYRSHGSSGSSGGSSSSHGSSGSSGGSSSSHGSSGSSGGWYSSHGSSGSSGGWYSSHGSSGSSSSHGSSGSSGGWYSSHGSSGSSSSHGSSGSSGGWYSSHGSSGSSSSHGSSGSSGGHVVYAHPVHPAPVAPAGGEAKPLAAPETTKADRAALLIVKVPADAVVYLMDQKMTLTGTERKYRIPLPEAGKEYRYPVRVEVVRDGKTLVSRSEQKIRGGQRFEVAVAESVDDGALVAVASR